MIACPVCMSEANLCGSNLAACARCTHVFQADLTVTVRYGAAYGKRTYDTYPEDTSYLRAGYVIGSVREENTRIMDVGYGSGSFLRVMRKAGWDVWGNDVHNIVTDIPRALLSDDRIYSAVTFFDSLEHFDRFECLRHLQTKNVFVTIPSAPRRFLEQPVAWRHYKPGEHLHYFTGASLARLWKGFGFNPVGSVCLEDVTRGPGLFLGDACENTRTYHFCR